MYIRDVYNSRWPMTDHVNRWNVKNNSFILLGLIKMAVMNACVFVYIILHILKAQ
jgi:hypothetical protein